MSTTTRAQRPDSPELARADWVEARLVRALMDNVRPATWATLAAVPVTAMMVHGDVSTAWLGAWVAVALFTGLLRLWVLQVYRRQMNNVIGPSLRDFMSRHGWTWPVTGLVWGLSAFLFFERVPLRSQFVCMTVLVGMGAVAVVTLSAHLRIFRAYVNSLCTTALAGFCWNMFIERNGMLATDDQALIVLAVIFWVVMLNVGLHYHKVQRQSYELQFDNSRLISTLTDETQSALEAVQLKHRLLASAAHDLRQPVHALSLYADWLRNEPELAPQITPKIIESTRAVNQLFDSLFDLARLEGGQVKVLAQDVDLRGLMKEIQTQYAPLAVNKGLDFRLHLPARDAHLNTDPVLLSRIIGNLVSNAIRYTDRGGVLLAARLRGESWQVEVWDTGIGIEPEARADVFREFYRIERHSGTQEGFGLGLAIVRRLSDVLGLEIELHSRPGRGTLFRVRPQAR